MSTNNFQTAVPSNEGLLTLRSLDIESRSNNDLFTKYNLTLTNMANILDGLSNESLITTREGLITALTDTLIRFDASPKFYQKDDYKKLLSTLTGALMYLYNQNPVSFSTNAPFIGVATLTTDPLAYAEENNQRYPGVYLAQTAGTYTNFDITVSSGDLQSSIVYLVPVIEQEFVNYQKIIYNLNVPTAGSTSLTFRYFNNYPVNNGTNILIHQEDSDIFGMYLEVNEMWIPWAYSIVTDTPLDAIQFEYSTSSGLTETCNIKLLLGQSN